MRPEGQGNGTVEPRVAGPPAAHGVPLAPPRRSRRSGQSLSKRERLVLAELARGGSTDEIAEALYVSPHTVRTHIKNVMRKLGARTRAHAVAIGMSDGVIESLN